MGEHRFHFIDRAEADFEIRVFFGGREMAASLAAPGFGEVGSEDRDGLKMVHCELTERSTGGFERIDGRCGWLDWGNPFVDVNEAVRGEGWDIEVPCEGPMPGNEAVMEVSHGVAVRVLDEGHDRVRGDALPAERIVRRKPRQRTDVLYHSEAIEVLEPAKTHISCTDSIMRSDWGYRLFVRRLFGIVKVHSLTRTPRGQLSGEFCLWPLVLIRNRITKEIINQS